MGHSIKLLETPKEAFEVFNQLISHLSRYGFERKNWKSNNDEGTSAILEGLKSKNNAMQVELELKGEGPSVLVLHGLPRMTVLKYGEVPTKKSKHP